MKKKKETQRAKRTCARAAPSHSVKHRKYRLNNTGFLYFSMVAVLTSYLQVQKEGLAWCLGLGHYSLATLAL